MYPNQGIKYHPLQALSHLIPSHPPFGDIVIIKTTLVNAYMMYFKCDTYLKHPFGMQIQSALFIDVYVCE